MNFFIIDFIILKKNWPNFKAGCLKYLFFNGFFWNCGTDHPAPSALNKLLQIFEEQSLKFLGVQNKFLK